MTPRENETLSCSVYETPKTIFDTNTTPRKIVKKNEKLSSRQTFAPNVSRTKKLNNNNNNNSPIKVLEKEINFLNLNDIERLAKQQEEG